MIVACEPSGWQRKREELYVQVTNFLNSMRKKVKRQYEESRKAVVHSVVSDADEAGMHVYGFNLLYLHGDIPCRIIWQGEIGIDTTFSVGLPQTALVADLLGLYFSLNEKGHQICLIHLLRNTTFFEDLLPECDRSKRMLELLWQSIHLRKT